jgi:predicted site-specific integrase-resolvase
MPSYSTVQLAKILNITSATLHRWIRQGKINAPPLQSLGDVRVRMWTLEDLERVKKFKGDHYWGKGSRRRQSKK